MPDLTPEGHRPPGHRAPADVGGSVFHAVAPTAGGAVLGLVLFAVRGGVVGVLLAVGCCVVGAWLGHRISDARADSDLWQAIEAARLGVATPAQIRRINGQGRR